MHLGHKLAIAQAELAVAIDTRRSAWDRLEAAITARPHIAALRTAYEATRYGDDNHSAAYRAFASAALVELYAEWSAQSIASAVEYLAQQRLAALRALAAADTYECAAGAGVAQ